MGVNLDQGREYRPNAARSVFAIDCKTVTLSILKDPKVTT